MSASIHYLPVSQRFRTMAEPLPDQAMIVPIDPVDRQALDFWRASQDVRAERRTLHSVLFGKRRAAEDRLHRLTTAGLFYSLRNRARQTLVDCGAAAAFATPRGPFDGSVA